MTKYIEFNEQSQLCGRYDSEINADVPECAIEVGDDLFFKTINETDGIWTLVDGEFAKLPFPAPTFAVLKTFKRQEINSAFESSMQQIVGSIPVDEISSWGKQEYEARAYQVSHTAVTPLIDALASARSVSKVELMTRIIAKADLFASISGTFIGKRQGLEDQLDALPETADAEAIAGITW